jgi:hypothetical protein
MHTSSTAPTCAAPLLPPPLLQTGVHPQHCLDASIKIVGGANPLVLTATLFESDKLPGRGAPL